MTNIIYADNAATTCLDPDAYEAMKPFLLSDFGNPSNTYSFSRAPRKALNDARQIIAECIGANYDEIVFTSGGTEGINWAIKGTALKNKFKKTHIITSSFEHHAVLNSCSFLEKIGFDVNYLPIDQKGYLSKDTLREYLRPDTKLVSIMLANNEIGTIQDLRGFSEITKNNQSILHTDAVQAVGHIPIDVKYLDIDLLSASAHKFNGPKGVGFNYIKKGTELFSLISGGKQEKGLRAGTENIAGIVGMAVALKKNCEKINKNRIYLHQHTKKIITMLHESDIDFLENGSEERLPGIISISIKDQEGESIIHQLDLKGIIISTGSACSSGTTEISHVIKAIGTPVEYAMGTIRISLGVNNKENDAKIIAQSIASIVKNN